MPESTKAILIVEDEAFLRDAMMRRFSEEPQFRMLQAADGEAGLAVALKERPDLILLDLLLPKMDGIEVLKRLRADPWGRDVAIIILTNVSGAEKVREAVEGKVFDYLVKADWKLDDVVRRVKEKLGLKP